MKNKNFFILILSVAGLALNSACGPGSPKDTKEGESVEQSAEKLVQPVTVFENDYAKVAKVILAPGEALAPHDAQRRLIYSLTDYSIDWEENGENQGVKTWKKGDVHVHGAGEHSAKNSGGATAEWLVFVRKTEDLPDCSEYSIEKDVNAFSENFAKMLLDNEDFRITEITLAPGREIPMHSGINRIIYSLSNYKINYQSDKEGVLEKTFRSGDAHWHEACEHALENTGNTEAHFLVVAYKKK